MPERFKQCDVAYLVVIYWVFRQEQAACTAHDGRRRKRSKRPSYTSTMGMPTMALSMLWSTVRAAELLSVSKTSLDPISPTPSVGCTTVHSLGWLPGLKNWFSVVRPRTGNLGSVGSQSQPCCTPGKCLDMFSDHP